MWGYLKCGEILYGENFIYGEIFNVKKLVIYRVNDKQFTLFCPGIVVTHILSLFTHFLCGEKLEMTNMMYDPSIEIYKY